jgi:hypothetical protein
MDVYVIDNNSATSKRLLENEVELDRQNINPFNVNNLINSSNIDLIPPPPLVLDSKRPRGRPKSKSQTNSPKRKYNKLTTEQFYEIKLMMQEKNFNVKNISIKYNVHPNTIRNIKYATHPGVGKGGARYRKV